LSGLGKCHPHRARAAAAAVFASTAVADTELERGSPSPSSSSSSSSAPPYRAAGFQNGGHPQTRAFRLPEATVEGAATAAANTAEEPVATDLERAIRCSRSMRLWTRPTASPEAEEEDDGDAAQAHGRTCAQLGQSRRRRSRRQYGHTPPPDLAAGCFQHLHSSPPPPPPMPSPAGATAAFSAFIDAAVARRLLLCSSFLGRLLLACSLSLCAGVRGRALPASLLKKSGGNGTESIIRG